MVSPRGSTSSDSCVYGKRRLRSSKLKPTPAVWPVLYCIRQKGGSGHCRKQAWLLKNPHSRTSQKFHRAGFPINDVLDFGGHFLPLGWDGFSKEGAFSTATGDFTQNDPSPTLAEVLSVIGMLRQL
jgi:hypothetical protein